MELHRKKKQKRPPKKKAGPTKRFVYKVHGSLAHGFLLEGAEEFENQVACQLELQNAVGNNERHRRSLCMEVLRERYPNLAHLECEKDRLDAEVDALRDAAKARNAQARRKRATPEESAAIRAKAAEAKAAREAFQAAKEAAYADPAVKDDLKAVNEHADWLDFRKYNHLKRTRNMSAHSRAIVMADTRGRRAGRPPKPKTEEVECRVGLQIKRARLAPLLTPEVFLAGGARDCQVTVLSENTVGGSNGGVTYTKRFCEIRFPLTSRNRGYPIVYCKVRVHIHRLPPRGSAIKQLHLHRAKRGPSVRYELHLSVEKKDGFAKPDVPDTGVVAINLGWRQTEDGIRVATWHAKGASTAEVAGPAYYPLQQVETDSGSLVLPQAEVDRRWRYVEEIQSRRDNLFNEARARLAEWLGANASIVPAWLAERTRYMAQWKASRNMEELVVVWGVRRFAGDESMYRYLHGYEVQRGVRPDGRPRMLFEGWMLQDRHLALQMEGQRQRANRWRDYVYRRFAIALRRRYRKVILANTNWARLARNEEKDKPEDNKSANETSRWNRRVAAPGRFSKILGEMFGEAEKVEGKNITQTCSECLHRDAFDAKAEVVRTCHRCEAVADQDARAARNLLAKEGTGTLLGVEPAPAPEPEEEEAV
jgi:hypothetical protein